MTSPAVNFPAATITSSAAAASVASSATLTGSTPFGQAFGTSSGQQYASIGATGSNTGPSSTTLTFASPTPASGWGIALGDVDAESVQITATAPGGAPVPVSALGFAGTFNYAPSGTDVPTWNPTTGTLIGGGSDTAGATGWFRPTTPLASITLNFTTLIGTPLFQVWIAASTATISGTVTAPAAAGAPPTPVAGATVQVQDPAGSVVQQQTSAADGTFSLGPVIAGPVYAVTVTPPAGGSVVGSTTFSAATADGDVGGITFTVDPSPSTTTTSTTTSTAPPRSAGTHRLHRLTSASGDRLVSLRRRQG